MKILSDDTFDKAIKASPESIVMFSAPWAGPCNLVRPAFEHAASRYGNQLGFFEFVLDDNPGIPERLGVRQVPVFFVFKGGKVAELHAGAVSQETLLSICEKAIE